MTIILYDIPSKLPGIAWSPNTWKIRQDAIMHQIGRYYLNYRRIPYKTEWIEYPDIKAFSLLHSIPPTFVPPASTGKQPRYTLPAIHDPATGLYIADSEAIAEYLDKTYPESVSVGPGVFPDRTLGLQKAFAAVLDTILVSHVRLIVPAVAPHLNAVSEEYFRRTRQEAFKVQVLEDAIPKGEEAQIKWDQFKAEWDKVAKWYPSEEKGNFIMGDKLTWADIMVASELMWMKTIWGEESDKWNDVMRWNDGKWKVFESMQPYAKAADEA